MSCAESGHVARAGQPCGRGSSPESAGRGRVVTSEPRAAPPPAAALARLALDPSQRAASDSSVAASSGDEAAAGSSPARPRRMPNKMKSKLKLKSRKKSEATPEFQRKVMIRDLDSDGTSPDPDPHTATEQRLAEQIRTNVSLLISSHQECARKIK